jgi:hypothetical protein
MTRYCTRCTGLIPDNRVARGSCFCSTGCRRLDRIDRRRSRAEKSCRLCGRASRKPKTAKSDAHVLIEAPRPCAPGAQVELTLPLHRMNDDYRRGKAHLQLTQPFLHNVPYRESESL